MLLHLLRWLQGSAAIDIEIVCLRGGPLVADLQQLGPVKVLDIGWTGTSVLIEKAFRQATTHSSLAIVKFGAALARQLRRRLFRHRFGSLADHDLIYANSAVAAICFDSLPVDRPPILTHVHELEFALRRGIPADAIADMHAMTDRFIACSEAVRTNLMMNHGVSSERIALCYEPIVANELPKSRTREGRQQVMKELGIPNDALLVGACGSREWRKGMDLFALVASIVLRGEPSAPVYFVWVGDAPPHLNDTSFRFDLAKLGLEDRVRLVGSTPVPHRYVSAFDVFALTSREDPFPLVALEASAMEIPIVAFDSGGIKEMIPEGCGKVVRYADVGAMAESVRELLADPSLREHLGSNAAERVRSRYDIEVVGPAILSAIDEASSLAPQPVVVASKAAARRPAS